MDMGKRHSAFAFVLSALSILRVTMRQRRAAVNIQVGAFRRELASLNKAACHGLRALAAKTFPVLRFASNPSPINIVGRVRAVTFDRG